MWASGCRAFRGGGAGVILFAVLTAGAFGGAAPGPEQELDRALGLVTNQLDTIQGVVTWQDETRGLLVLQDGDRVKALRMDGPGLRLRCGEQVQVTGREYPLVDVLPAFPFRPDRVEILPALDAPTNAAGYCCNRLTGWIVPPVTGYYTFWISSDDSSELWLSATREPAAAQRVALVAPGRFTNFHEWEQRPEQKSSPVWLNAGAACYVEVLQQNGVGLNSVAVAWQGPGGERKIISEIFLQPDAPRRPGVRWEQWTNFYSADLAVLRRTNGAIRNFVAAQVIARQPAPLPPPVTLVTAEDFATVGSFRRVEVVGRLGFCSEPEGRGCELMPTNGMGPVRVRFAAAGGKRFPPQALVRVCGVYESGDPPQDGVLWASSPEDLAWVDSEENWSQYPPLPVQQLAADNLALCSGQWLRLQGRLRAATAGGAWVVEARDVFRGYTSPDGTNWTELGDPVEIAASNSILAGFVVASHDVASPVAAEFDSVAGLPDALQGVQIGRAELPGSFQAGGDRLRLTGGGWNIWSRADDCYFVYQALEGAGTMTARLRQLQARDPLGKAALMMRTSLDRAAPWAGIVRLPDGRTGLQTRRERRGLVSGVINGSPDPWLKLSRQRNTFTLRVREQTHLQAGEVVDCLGPLAWAGTQVCLVDPLVRRHSAGRELIPALPPGVPEGDAAMARVPIGELVASDRRNELEARESMFRIQGAVTFVLSQPGEDRFFVQDETGACLVRLGNLARPRNLVPGCEVQLTGLLSERAPMPEFRARGVAVLGPATMPPPLRYPFAPAAQERRRGKWVEFEGVGRSVREGGMLAMMTREGSITLRAAEAEVSRIFPACLNALIRVRGVFWEGAGAELLVPAGPYLTILERAPEDAFAVPAFPIARLAQLDREWWSGRRRKVAGVLTCRREDQFVVQDASGGLRVRIDSPVDVGLGESIEVVGFLTAGGLGTEMSGALVRRAPQQYQPRPVELATEGSLNRSNHMRLVWLQATVLQTSTHGRVQSLDLQQGQRAFRAVLPASAGQLPPIPVGSKVRITGVSEIEGADLVPAAVPGTVLPLAGKLELWLRQPQDVVVIQRPPWWNWKYTVAAVAISGAGGIAALVWIRTLRRRVNERTRALRATMDQLEKKTQISATLAERERLAGEIHDSIEQGLSAIVLQIESALKHFARPEQARRHLGMAKSMAVYSRSEVQNAVWDMQSPLLTNIDLAGALRRVAQSVSAGGQPQVRVELSGTPAALSSTSEHHLLRLAQEAITNAIKHARAREIAIHLAYEAGAVQLRIRDDGCGFVPGAVSTTGGHFGLQGMQARAQKIHARLTVESAPGQGTCIIIVAPRDHAEALPPPAIPTHFLHE